MDYLKYLPKELLLYILSFTYQPQSTNLLEDVRNYVTSRAIVREMYFDRFAWEYPNAEHDWFNNDLFGFYNNDHALMYGFKDCFLDILRRSFKMKKWRQDNPSLCKWKDPVAGIRKQNSIMWGLLTIPERTQFIENF